MAKGKLVASAQPVRTAASTSAYVNDLGELCIGGKCITIKLGERDEVGVVIDEAECTDAERAALQKLTMKVMTGAPTVYQVKPRPR